MFAWVLVVGVAALIFLGAQVKSHNAGLAEPDWPLGYGQVMPRMVGGVFWEHGHRMAGATIGVLTLIAALWTHRRDGRAWLRRLGWWILGLVSLQGLLGGLTVYYLLPPPISVAHGALAQSLLCLVGWWALALGPDWQPGRGHATPTVGGASRAGDAALARAWRIALLAVGVVFVQLLLGAVMRHTEAGLAVPFFPVDAQGRWLPEFVDQRVVVHMAHRLWAVVVMVAVWRACVVAATTLPRLMGHGTWLAALVLFQGLLGASVVWMEKHPLVTSVHVVNGAVILLLTWLLALRLWRARRPVPAAPSGAAA